MLKHIILNILFLLTQCEPYTVNPNSIFKTESVTPVLHDRWKRKRNDEPTIYKNILNDQVHIAKQQIEPSFLKHSIRERLNVYSVFSLMFALYFCARMVRLKGEMVSSMTNLYSTPTQLSYVARLL